jgi:hypothetical protein
MQAEVSAVVKQILMAYKQKCSVRRAISSRAELGACLVRAVPLERD